jgi:hypothetical protein
MFTQVLLIVSDNSQKQSRCSVSAARVTKNDWLANVQQCSAATLRCAALRNTACELLLTTFRRFAFRAKSLGNLH